MKNPFSNIKRGAEIALKSWFNITAMERKVILLITGLFILGMIVKYCRDTHPRPERAAEHSGVTPGKAPGKRQAERPVQSSGLQKNPQ